MLHERLIAVIACQILRLQTLFHRSPFTKYICGCGQYTQSVRWMSRKKQPKQAADKVKWLPRTLQSENKHKIRTVPANLDQFLASTPQDDIYIKMYYPPVKYTAETALEMHREVAVPEMLNNEDGFVHLTVDINMATSKKTKFIAAFQGIVQLSHYFDDGTQNTVLALCKTKDEQSMALDAGATFAGGLDIIAQLESGEIRPYMFDHAVTTFDFIEEITKARKYMRDKFPNKRAGGIGSNIVDLINYFKTGKNYSCTKVTDELATMQVVCGKLNMPMEHLLENFKKYIETINSHRPVAKTQKITGPFITKAFLTCPPSGEKIHLCEDEIKALAPKQTPHKVAKEEILDDEPEETNEPQQHVAASS